MLLSFPNAKEITHIAEINWVEGSVPRPTVSLTLQKSIEGGEYTNVKTVSVPNGATTYTFNQLDPRDTSYRVVEAPVEGYVTTYDYSQTGKSIITNTKSVTLTAVEQTVLLSTVPENGSRKLSQDEAKRAVSGTENFPENTQFEWEGTPQANYNSLTPITNGVVIVKYSNGSTKRVEKIKVNFRDNVKPIISEVANRTLII